MTDDDDRDKPKRAFRDALNDMCVRVQRGRLANVTDATSGPRLLEYVHFRNEAVDWEALPFCDLEEPRIAEYQVQPGDLFVQRRGRTGGTVFVIRECPVEAVFGPQLIRVRLREGIDLQVFRDRMAALYADIVAAFPGFAT